MPHLVPEIHMHVSEVDRVPSSGTAPPACAGRWWLCRSPASEAVCSSSLPHHSSSTAPAWKDDTPTENSAPASQNLQENSFSRWFHNFLVGREEKLKLTCQVTDVR